MALPTTALARKQVPIYSGFIKYFPRAIAEVAALSFVGNEQHNPGTELHWDRTKSGDEMDAAMRHIVDGVTHPCDVDGILHATKHAWRAMANLEKLLEVIDADVVLGATEECVGCAIEDEFAPAGSDEVGFPCGDPQCSLCAGWDSGI